MKIRILFLSIPVFLLCTACETTQSKALVHADRTDDCRPMPPGRKCRVPDPPTKKIVITYGALGAAPAYYCAEPGQTIDVKVVGANAPKTVATVPENAGNIWLIGVNDADAGGFQIVVPEDTDSDEYKYRILQDDGQCLDPIVIVMDRAQS